MTIVTRVARRLRLKELLRRVSRWMRDVTIDAVRRARIDRLPARQENVKVIVERLLGHDLLMALDARIVAQLAQRYRGRVILAAFVCHQINSTLG